MSASNQPFQPPQPYVPMAKRKRRWVIPVVILAVLFVIIIVPIIFFATIIGSVSNFESKPVEITKNTVLVIELNNFPEVRASNPFAIFSGGRGASTMFDFIGALKAAKTDDNVKGIYIKPGIGSFGFAKADEISAALKDFKSSGKFIYAYLPFATENSYYIASVADSIFAPSMGFFEMNGFGTSGLFMKKFFDKIGIDMYVEHFEDFKSAGESLSRENFSDSSKKQLRTLLEQRFEEFTNELSANRKINKTNLLAAINRGQYTADSLLALGLLDGISTPNDFEDKVYYKVFGKMPADMENEKKSDSKKVNYVSLAEYAGTNYPLEGKVYNDKIKIAIIQAAGEISSGSQNLNPGANNEGITDDRMIEQLEEVRKDKEIKAVIIRIDSPGGSALASDNIWQEIMKVRKTKPVYASMSDVAASGGYYISMACDTIVAYPNTITGSIGVISLVPNLSGLAGKLGFTSDTINVGDNSQFMNGMYPYNENDKAKFRAAMKTIYFDFVGKAAQSRKKSFEDLRAVAKGRVWNGTDALRLGLIDKIGNYQTVIDLAKQRLGIPLDKKVLVEIYPKPEDELEDLINFFKKIGNMQGTEIASMLSNLGLKSSDMTLLSGLYSTLPESMQTQIKYNLKLLKICKQENILMVMPFYL